MPSKTTMLSEVPLFSRCTSRELSHIARLGSSIVVPDGEVVIREGTMGDAFYVIERGKAEVTIGGEHAAWLKEGDFVGEMALLEDLPRTATVVARGPLKLFVISARDFSAFLDQSPKVIQKMLAVLTSRIREAERAPGYS